MLHRIDLQTFAEILHPYARLKRNYTLEIEWRLETGRLSIDRITLSLIALDDGCTRSVIPVSKLRPVIKRLTGEVLISLSSETLILVSDRLQLTLHTHHVEQIVPVVDIRAAILPCRSPILANPPVQAQKSPTSDFAIV